MVCFCSYWQPRYLYDKLTVQRCVTWHLLPTAHSERTRAAWNLPVGACTSRAPQTRWGSPPRELAVKHLPAMGMEEWGETAVTQDKATDHEGQCVSQAPQRWRALDQIKASPSRPWHSSNPTTLGIRKHPEPQLLLGKVGGTYPGYRVVAKGRVVPYKCSAKCLVQNEKLPSHPKSLNASHCFKRVSVAVELTGAYWEVICVSLKIYCENLKSPPSSVTQAAPCTHSAPRHRLWALSH